MSEAKCCVLVANAEQATIYLALGGDHAPVELVEHSRIINGSPLGNGFVVHVAQSVVQAVADWQSGVVILAAEPAMLGLLRDSVQAALPKHVALKALAKDCVGLTPPELVRRLSFA